MVETEDASGSLERQRWRTVIEGSEKYEEPRFSHSPVCLFSLTAIAIFIADIILMLVLSYLPQLSKGIDALVDGSLLTLFLIPTLYFTLFRPMEMYIGELSRAGKRLRSEIAERLQIELALLESERNLRQLSSELLATQERERGRVSKELHEDLGQALAAVKLSLHSINKDWRRAKPQVRDEWERNMKTIDQAIENVRRFSRALGPSAVEDFGLSSALQRHANSLMKNRGIQVSLDLTDADSAFEQKRQMIICRILEEALLNVEQHSGANHAAISVRRDQDHFVFQVGDDGRGFDTNQFVAKSGVQKGLGLETMFEGARMVDGKLDIWSEPGKGARVTLRIPIESKTNSIPQHGREDERSESTAGG